MASSYTTATNHVADATPLDLVGEPFAVIESDPLVFTNLLRGLATGLECEEVYTIAVDELARLKPKALIFCYNDAELDEPVKDEDAQQQTATTPAGLWFANQVASDACASIALLNIVYNLDPIVDDFELGPDLEAFRDATQDFDPKMKGLAIPNFAALLRTHNSLARPADRRSALSSLSIRTMSDEKAAKSNKKTRKGKSYGDSHVDTFHFIAYLPWRDGTVYELNGFANGPVPVGSFSVDSGMTWIDAVHPRLVEKMARLGGIRSNMLALVQGKYEAANDDLELLKRRKAALERRMGDNFRTKVDLITFTTSGPNFVTPLSPNPAKNDAFSRSFGLRVQDAQQADMKLDDSALPAAWERCVEEAGAVKQRIEDLLEREQRAEREHLSRTHDYEPFIVAYIQAMANEGLLQDILETASQRDPGSGDKGKVARGRGRGRGRARGRGKR